MKLEIASVNEIKDTKKVKSSREKLNKAHKLKFKSKKLKAKESCIQKLIKKEFKLERAFSALNLVKYKYIAIYLGV